MKPAVLPMPMPAQQAASYRMNYTEKKQTIGKLVKVSETREASKWREDGKKVATKGSMVSAGLG